MAWIFLMIAGVFEVVWSYAMKLSDGFTRPAPTIVMIVTMGLSFGFLALAMRTLPLGTTYTIWTGAGAIGAFVIGIVVLGEEVSAMRLIAAALIVTGLITMKLASPH